MGIAEFHMVSFDQFLKDVRRLVNIPDSNLTEEAIRKIYNDITLPVRSTSGSAGYDFVAPFTFPLTPDVQIVPTGICCEMDKNWVLQLYPRSSVATKRGLHIVNTVGIVDSDYFHNADNEGHILVYVHKVGASLYNTSPVSKIEKGERFVQGIFMRYGLTVSDEPSTDERVGGIGSTGK